MGIGKHVALADRSQASANAAAEVLGNAGYEVSVATVDVSSREAVHALVGQATSIGDIVGLIHAAGSLPVRHLQKPSFMWICTALPWCLKNSGTLLRPVGPAL